MADDRKTLAAGGAETILTATADPEVAALKSALAALQKEIDGLKTQAAPGRVQVEGIFTGAPPAVPKPVQDVIAQYEALKRALLSPVPAWVYPGSAPAPAPTGTGGTSPT